MYTALFGEYENLLEQPRADAGGIPFICFTDDATLTSSSWDVRVVPPAFPLDSVRSARMIKIVGHDDLREFDETLWIDNRVILTATPDEVLDAALAASDLSMFEHSFRDKLIDEFSEIVRGGYDDPTRVYEQLIHYAETTPDVLDERPVWTGFIARRHSDAVARAMQTWISHVLRYSRRDQLSINLALRAPGLQSFIMPSASNHESDWHEWPTLSPQLGRKVSTRSTAFAHSIRAPLARVADLQLEATRATEQLEAERTTADARTRAISAEYEQALRVVADLREQLVVRDQQVADLEEQLTDTTDLYRGAQGRATARKREVARLQQLLDGLEQSRIYRISKTFGRRSGGSGG